MKRTILCFTILFLINIHVQTQIPAMKSIPSGWFEMGCTSEQATTDDCDEDESPVSNVYVGAFEMGITEVTQSEFAFQIPNLLSNNQYCVGPEKPMVGVSFYDILTYCNRLSIAKGLRPAYYSDSGLMVPFDSVVGGVNESFYIEVYWDKASDGFRIPTESEWEYAARAGSTNIFAGSNDPKEVAWYHANVFSPFGCRDVALKSPNAYGLYDMSGNTWEYCWDLHWYYPDRDRVRPVGPSTGWFGQRILRGGSYLSYDDHIRVSERGSELPSLRRKFIGFRLARGAYILPCMNNLINPANGEQNVSICTPIRWNKSNDVILGYRLYVGTQPGEYDLFDGIIVQDTVFYPADFLPENDSIFVKIVPFTDAQSASFCTEFVFETGVGAPDPLLEIEAPLFDSVCFEYIQKLSAIGDTTLSLVWNTGDSTVTTQAMGYGDFILEWVQEGCLLRDTVTIAKAENISVIGQAYPTYPGQSTGRIDITQVTGGTPPYRYDWYYSPEIFSTDPVFFSHERNLTGLDAGSYNLYMNDTLDCGSPFASFYFLVEEDSTSVSIVDPISTFESTLFPNPVRGGIFMVQTDFSIGDYQYALFDIHGRSICFKKEANPRLTNEIIVDLQKDIGLLPEPGIYILQLVVEGRYIYHKVIILE